MGPKKVDPARVWKEYEKGIDFKTQLNLYDTVENNENFYIGKQWEGVVSNGLPTPVFDFIRRIVLFLVASVATDNLKLAASPLPSSGQTASGDVERVCRIINAQFEALFEQNKIGRTVRGFMRNAAVDGDGCIYSWFDPEVVTGQAAQGAIRVQLLENTRVIFGNPNDREVQSQPYLLLSRRELLEDVRREAEANGQDPEAVKPDNDEANDRFDAMTDGKVTTLMRLWKDRGSGTVRAVKTVRDAVVRPEWDTGQKRYPIVWLSWDAVRNCYHGQAAVTGLIPNQIFVNKMFAMTYLSQMTTAYPKILYDKSRVDKWDSRVGAAIPVNPGDRGLNDVAKVMDPAVISPQVSQFIDLTISTTKECMGATDAALGNVKPDNTSAIIALQKSSSVPMEMVKQDLYQALEDLGLIWLDLMRVYYGTRYVELPPTQAEEQAMAELGIARGAAEQPQLFDFSGQLEALPLSLKLDVGASAYWSEIAQVNTLDNLLMADKITIEQYLERMPNGYIAKQLELLDELRQARQMGMAPSGGAPGPMTGEGEAYDPALQAGRSILNRKLQQVF